MHQSSENSLMNDHLSYELLASYLFFYYKFTPKEKLYIQQHLTQCQECKKAFLSIVQFESDTSTSVVYSMRSSQKQGSIIFTNGNHKIALKADTDNILKDILIYPKSQNWFYIKIILIDSEIYLTINPDGQLASFNENLKINIAQIQRIEQLTLSEEIDNQSSMLPFNGWIKYAAAAIIFLGILTTTYLNFFRQPTLYTSVAEENTPLQQNFDSLVGASEKTITPQAQDVLKRHTPTLIAKAENFISNPTLDALADMKYRAGASLRIIAPLHGDTLSRPVKIEISTTDDSVSVILLDNLGNQISRFENIKREVYIKTLKPGLFYWQIFQGKKLISTRKFILKG